MPNRVSGRPSRLRKTKSSAERPWTSDFKTFAVRSHIGHQRSLLPLPLSLIAGVYEQNNKYVMNL